MANMSHLIDMTDKVVARINKGTSFKEAFATTAHERGIYHGRDSAQYNYHFREVMKQVKEKIGSDALSRACKKQVPITPLHQAPVRPDFKKLAAHDIDPD